MVTGSSLSKDDFKKHLNKSSPRKRESSYCRISEILDPRFRGDDRLDQTVLKKSIPAAQSTGL